MKKLLTGVLFALMSVSLMFAQGGVATPIRSGAALPSGALQWSLFALTTGNTGLYQCTASPCTTSTQWNYYGYMPALPTTPDNMQYVLGSTPLSGAQNPTWIPPGIFGRQFTSGASTDTLLYTDNSRFTIYSNGAVGVALTVAQAGTGNFTNHATFPIANIGTANVVLTTTTSTINGSGSTATMYPNTSCTLHSLDNANWLFRCVPILDSTGLLLPSSLPVSALTAAAALVSGNLVQGAGANRTTSDSGIATTNVATAASNYVSGNLVQGAGANKTTSDSGIATTNVVTQTSNGAANQICTYSGANKICVPATTLPTAAMPALTGAVTNTAGTVATTPGKVDVANTNEFCADAGSTDAYACNLAPAITAYVTGTHYRFKANTANTTVATVNFNSVGVATIKKAAGGITTDLATNDILVGQWVDLIYDGTNMQMQSLLGNAPGGSGTVTSVGLAGTANQVTVTGATPITGSGSWTLSLPAALNIGTDGSTAGTVQMANGSAAAHTIWGSAATTTNTILGFAVVPANGDLTDCSVSTTTCTLHDSGLATANVVTAGSNFVSGNLVQGAGANKTASDSTIPTANVTTAAANYVSGNLVQGAGANKTTSDSTIPTANVVTQTSNGAANQVCTYTGANKVCVPGPVTNAMLAGSIALTNLAAQAANTVVANVTSGSAAPTATAIPAGIQNYVAGTGYNQSTAHQMAAPVACAGSASATAPTCTTAPSFTPASGDCVNVTWGANNSGALTLNVNSSTNAPVQKWLGTALALNDVVSGKTTQACYDGTNWQIDNIGNSPSGSGTITGSATANQGVNGTGATAIASGFTNTAGTVTSGKLACYTASNTIGNCIGTPSNNIIGVFNTSTTWIASGETAVTLDATVNVTFGDILCASSSAGVAHDNGSISCASGEWIGVVKTTAASVSSATAFVALR